MPTADSEDALLATSPSGRCTYRASGALHSVYGQRSVLWEPEGFHGITFARFIGDDVLAIALTCGSYLSAGASAGYPLGLLEVFRRVGQDWQLVGFAQMDRDFSDPFVPDDVAWHPRGVLAWLIDGTLEVMVGSSSPASCEARALSPREVPDPDDLALEASIVGDWTRLELDDDGVVLTARGDSAREQIDLVHRRRRRDNGPWEPWAPSD